MSDNENQAKENADDLLKEKIELEKEKKALVESAAEKDALLRTKIKTVGNYVHDSVPVSNNEVCPPSQRYSEACSGLLWL